APLSPSPLNPSAKPADPRPRIAGRPRASSTDVLRIRISLIATILLFLYGCNGSQKTFDEETKNLQVKLEQTARPQFVSNDSESRKLWNLTKQVYASRQFRPAWSAKHRSNSSADTLIATFDNAPAEGLHPENVSELHAMRDAVASSNDVFAAADF